MPNDVYCAFTGAIPDDADLPTDHPLEDEELSDLPVGWTRITIQTREPNPEWETILAVEQGMVKQVMDSVPKAQRKEATPGVRVQVAAQLAALKAATPPYNIVTDVFHVAPGVDALDKLRGQLAGEEGEGEAEGSEAEDGDAESEEATGA
jgi:hypothetical protein